jgi:hypothetical protein
MPATDGNIDEYERWKTRELKANKDSYAAVYPIKHWVGLCDRYPDLAQMAIDMLSTPALSCECERMLSELGDLLEPTAADLILVTSCYTVRTAVV